MALAFFIYGIFNPSWAARLWYNVRTFPSRVTSWISSGKEFLDYDSYKSKITSIWDSIWDKVESLGDRVEDFNLKDEIDIDIKYDEKEEKEEKNEKKDSENVVKDEDSSHSEKQTIKSFPKSIKFVEFPSLNGKNKHENKSEIIWQLTWYSKSDLLWVINKYIEENLDDDTDILVTVEYEDDSNDPQRIILETQSKIAWNTHSVYFSWLWLNELLLWSEWERVSDASSSDESVKTSNNQVQNNIQVNKTTSNKLTQKDQQEAEEIFSILF